MYSKSLKGLVWVNGAWRRVHFSETGDHSPADHASERGSSSGRAWGRAPGADTEQARAIVARELATRNALAARTVGARRTVVVDVPNEHVSVRKAPRTDVATSSAAPIDADAMTSAAREIADRLSEQ